MEDGWKSPNLEQISVIDREVVMKLYRQIDVWVRSSDSMMIRYRCFQILPDNLYCVQNADIFIAPVSQRHIREFENLFHELLLEEAPEVRSEPATTLEEAIRQHQEAFRDLEEEAPWRESFREPS